MSNHSNEIPGEGCFAVEKPLARKLALQSVLAALVLGLVVALMQIGLDLRGEVSRFESTIQNLLKVASPPAARAVYTLDRANAREVLAGLFAFDFVIEAHIVDEKEKLLAGRENDNAAPAGATHVSDWLFGGVAEHKIALHSPVQDQPYTGELYLRADPAIALSSFVDRALLIVTFGLARNVLLALILVWLYSRFLARPLERFIRALATVEVARPQDTVLPSLPNHQKDEIGLLSATVQRLLQSSGGYLELLGKAEQTLSKSEAKFRDLIESSNQGIIISRDGKIIFANRALADILGYEDPNDLAALHSLFEFVAPAERERLTKYSEQRRKGLMPPASYEFQAVRRDGRLIWLENYARIIDWEGEQATQSVLIDVTERRAAERALRESEQRFRAFNEASPMPISMKTPDGVILLANRQFELFYEIDPGQAINKKMRSLVPSDRADLSESTDREIIESGEILQFEATWKQHSGATREVILTKFPIMDSENQLAMIGSFVVDVTSLKEAEQQLHQSQKMQAIGQLTGGIAHDFNNILAIMIGNLELISQAAQKGNIEQRMLETTMRAAERGARLTQQLLAFARRQVLSPGPVDARALVSDSMDMIKRALNATIRVELTGEDDLWTCEADPVQMENALLNLVINARDAMPDGGRLTIETANAYLDKDYCADLENVSAGQYVMVSVTDEGCGMSVEVKEKVFEPFFTTKPVGVGTGLGLSMVFGFVKQSNGHISVESEEGKGTTFKIYLPRLQSKDLPASAPSVVDEHSGHGEKVLVVEDNIDMRELSVSLLQSLGYEVVSAPDGSAALPTLEAEDRVDLLLTDVVLPGSMNGIEFAERARALRPGLRVLFMSGYSTDIVAQEGRLEKNIPLLHKPFRRTDLARKVRLVLDESK